MKRPYSHRIESIIRQNDDILRKKFIRLDKNELSFTISDDFIETLRSAVSSELISRYPDTTDCYKSVGNYFRVNPNQILLTSGADAAIKGIYECFTNVGDKVIVPINSYGMHDVYRSLFEVELIEVDFFLDGIITRLKSILKKMRVRLVFIENPSGSTGQMLNGSAMQELLDFIEKENIILVIDETYCGLFARGLELKVSQRLTNIVIIKSFSKLFSLAGLRGGGLISGKSNIESLRKSKPMHEMSSFTALAVEIIVKNPQRLEQTQTLLSKELEKIERKVSKDAFELYFGYANFFLIKPRWITEQSLYSFLRNEGILIKDSIKKGKYAGYFRISLGSPLENDTLVAALDRFRQSLTIQKT